MSAAQAARGREWLRELLDSLRQGVILYDLDGRLVDLNARARELLGLDADTVSRLAMTEVELGERAESHPIPPLARLWPAILGGEHKRSNFEAAGPVVDLEFLGDRVTIGGEPFVRIELRDDTIHRRSTKALMDSKKQLEQGVLVRTRELQAKMRLIEQQQQELRELSTPVIQVWEGILVLPLIGEVDHERATQVTESILAAIVRTSSRQVIIDLTGVPSLDEEASAALLRTIEAVRLLGGDSSLTGISPAIARALVRGDLELTDSVRIFANLQAALKAAMNRQRGR
ncbi:STAS domain-containing protein [Pseudenhygromyxa sp. WMMC2535]|uniref:STAS domain-containing protein n=1 Tax=Pseudenhygromyxa sp. WMMC2535 TaxID=2712867 RepID=UPI0015580D75|nr:STAS domain-containing protein [Pseudenhygromyxa sp. WMMC2535]NVB42282.1 STAS domain-containing protein [Pseudenhygromyxa sp. WMMC2535]